MIKRNQARSILRTLLLFASLFVLTSCGASAAETGEMIIKDYYAAIEAGDAETAASFFVEDAVIVTPSGNILTGIKEIEATWIPVDLEYLDSIEFLTGFTETDGKVTWTQVYNAVDGNSFSSDCRVSIEDGKIVEWFFR